MADAAALTFAFLRAHPAEAARVLESASSSESMDLLARVPARIGSAVLAEMFAPRAAEVLLAMPEQRAFELLGHLDAQRVAAILRHVGAATRTRLLAGLPTMTAVTARLLLEFIHDAVGACMNPDVIAMAGIARVDEALDRVCHAHVAVDRVFIVDDGHHLLGWTPLGALLRAPASTRLETLVQPTHASLAAHAPLSGARIHPAWQATSFLPVVDRHGHLLGEITREALERASDSVRPTPPAESSLTGVLVHGYWQSISGLLELLKTMLPASRPMLSSRDEH